MDKIKCPVCENEYDAGYLAMKNLCIICRNYCEEKNYTKHPITNEPFQYCKCGKIWNQTCAFAAIGGVNTTICNKYGDGNNHGKI